MGTHNEYNNSIDKIHVLHVDDDSDLVELTATFLEKESDSITVTTETDAEVALEQLNIDLFDCIISDYDMPGMNGLELLKKVRKQSAKLPFILYTGKGSEEIASKAISAGVTDYLQKGTGPDQYAVLANRVESVVGKYYAETRVTQSFQAIETAHEGISLLDEEARFIYVNEAYADIYGYEPGELIGEHWSVLYSDNEAKNIEEEILPQVEKAGYWTGETTGKRKDGSTFIGWHTLALTENDALICVMRDVSDSKEKDKALQREQAVTESALDAIEDVFFVLDTHGKFRRWNQRLNDVTNCSGEEITSMHPTDFFDDKDAKRIQNAITTVIEEKETVTIEADLITRNGTRTPYEFTGSVLEDADGKPTGITGTGRKMGDQVQREDQLKRTERRFEAIFDDQESFIGLLTVDGTLLKANQTALNLIEAGAADVEGKRFWDTPWWSHSSDLQDDLRAWIDEASRGEFVRFDTTHRDRQGNKRRIDWIIRPVEAEHGEVESLIVEGRDITDRWNQKRRIRSLHTTTQRLLDADSRSEVAEITEETADNILGYSNVVVRLVAEDTEELHPVAVSSQAVEQMGERPVYKVGEGLAGQAYETEKPIIIDDFSDRNHGNDRDPVKSGMYLPIRGHGTVSINAEERGAFDESDTQIASILTANVETALDRIGKENDLEEHQKHLERRNEQLEAFADVLSHDLQNPLNVALGRIELARRSEGDASLDEIQQAVQRVSDLTTDLAKTMRSGAIVDEKTEIDLRETAEKAWQSMGTEEGSLTVTDSKTIEGDSDAILRMFENLISNASEHGGNAISVTVGTTETGFYIEDDGPGIPKEERDKVFEKGYTTKDSSSGFGLFSIWQIVQSHNWEISIADGSDEGARFEISCVN